MATFKNLFFCLSIITYSANAVQTEFNSYRGIQITPESLPSLIATPQYLQEAFNNWLLNTANKNGVKALDLIDQLNRKTTLKNLRTTEEENNALLESFGLSNKARWTYVFSFPEIPDYLIKISGPRLKYHNLLAENNVHHWSHQKPDSEEELAQRIEKLEEVSKQDTPTFQHISRIATWLKLKEQNYETIGIPQEMYLLHIPQKPTDICDQNYIILEKSVGDIEKIYKQFTSEQLETYYDEPAALEIVDAGFKASLWERHSNCYINPNGKYKKIYIIPVQQPDNSKSSDFHLQNNKKREHNVLCGLEDLIQLMSKSEIHLKRTLELIRDHQNFKTFENYQSALGHLDAKASEYLQALQKGKGEE